MYSKTVLLIVAAFYVTSCQNQQGKAVVKQEVEVEAKRVESIANSPTTSEITSESSQHFKDFASNLHVGDLVFQDLDCGLLCEAIEAVTDGIDDKEFSHVAMVVDHLGELKIIEAISEEVKINSLTDFYNRSKDIYVARVKKEMSDYAIPAANFSLSMIGAPYDNSFRPNNNALYCSEVIVFSYQNVAGEQLFTPNPMTYKDPKTGELHKAWEMHFSGYVYDAPEGELGWNPGKMSRDEKLDIIWRGF